ncbi:MAG: LytTR family transcriptional regulator [Clostridiales bacterium]|nr:LytTR family transcriptional regulator [Clostridiales bacterium]
MNIGILEYDKEIAYQLTEVINVSCPHNQIKVWEQESSLKEDISNGGFYKILFLSLEKNPMEIIEYSRRLQELYTDVKIIYLTELNDSVFEVFHSTPTYVLEKPLNIGYVKKALDKAMHELSLSKDKNFTIINKQGIYTIPYMKIYYVESDKRKLNIYGEDGLVKTINLKISDFLKYEHGIYFLQCHKSYAVNLMHISQLEKYEIVLENGMKLPISQSRYMDTKSHYVSYLENE